MGLLRRNQKTGADTVIDLREPASSGAPEITVDQWGSPVACPACGGPGYLDHIDPFREVMYQHCVACDERYAIAKADLEAASSPSA